MEPRQQGLVGLVLGLAFILIGVLRGWQRSRLTLSQKLDYGYVLKLIFLALAMSAAILNLVLMLLFVVAWGIHIDPPGASPAGLESFLPMGYPVHVVVGVFVAGGLCLFALAVIGFLDHINTG